MGEEWHIIEQDLTDIIEPGLCHWSHPGYMAYFPASTTFEGILGELYSAAWNNPAFDWVCSPSIAELEDVVISWLANLLNLPESFQGPPSTTNQGVIMSSTTETLITTMVAARTRCLGLLSSRGEDIARIRNRLVVLGTSQTHPSTAKAAMVVGVRYRSVDCCPVTGTAMTGEHLANLLNQCDREGLIPFYVTATLGTTNSLAVDDFAGIHQMLVSRPEVWVHVDAAFAGAALVCDEYLHLARSLANIQSISINLGKWMLINLECT